MNVGGLAFDVDQYWVSNYKAECCPSVIHRRAYVWFKFGVFLAGGDLTGETFAEMIRILVFIVIKKYLPDYYDKIKKDFVGGYIHPQSLKIASMVNEVGVERYVGAIYSTYVTRNAVRKLRRFVKYQKYVYKADVLVVNDMNEIIGVKYFVQKERRVVQLENGRKIDLTVPGVSEAQIKKCRQGFLLMKQEMNVSLIDDNSNGCCRKLIPTLKFFIKFWCTTVHTQYLTQYHELNQVFPARNNNNNNNNNNDAMDIDVEEDVDVGMFDEEKDDEKLETLVKKVSAAKFKIHRDWSFDENSNKWFTTFSTFGSISLDSFPATYPDPSKTLIQVFPHIFYAGFDQFGCLYLFLYSTFL